MYCQKCRQPLKVDTSLNDLNPAAYDILISSTSTQSQKAASTGIKSNTQPHEESRKGLYETAAHTSGQPSFKRHHGSNARDNAMSFIYLTESQVDHPRLPNPQQSGQSAGPSGVRPTSISKSSGDTDGVDEMDRLNRLFEILSSRSDVDHPICVDCTDMLLDGLQKKLEVATKERDCYVQHLRKLQSEIPSAADVKAQEEALKKAEKDRETSLQVLIELEDKKDAIDAEILALEEESRQLSLDEEKFWAERNEFAGKMTGFQEERDSINVKYNNDSELLQKLQRSNVYNDTFNISHDGSFATINGLRLGRLSNKPVDWPEINAAWGHALLLLVTVADKLDFKFNGYEARPMGSTSRIIRYESPVTATSRIGSRAPQYGQVKKHELELFSSGDMPLGLTFMHRKFDNAMVAFLDLVQQLGNHVTKQTEGTTKPLSLPYIIEGDKIGEVSIKLGIARDDSWTKACKLTLTCCKFLLAHASNVGSSNRTVNQ